MKTFIFWITTAATLCGIAYTLHWSDAFHLTCGAIAIATCVAGAAARWVWNGRTEQVEAADPDDDVHPLRLVVFGLLTGCAGTVGLGVLFATLQRVPWIVEQFDDRDRLLFNEQILALQTEGNHGAVARKIEERLNKKITQQWERQLATTWQWNLIQAGLHAANAQDAKTYLTKAQAVAERFSQYALSDDVPRILLAAIDREAQQLAQFAAQTEELHQATRERAGQDLRTLLERLLAASEKLIEPGAKRGFLLALKQFFQEKGVDIADLTRRLQFLESEAEKERVRTQEQLRPTSLPRGCRSEILSISKVMYPPCIGIDLAVDDETGKLVRNLQLKDFQVAAEGKLRLLSSAEIHNETAPLNVVVACDTSGSMQGAALEQEKQGVRAFINCLQNQDAWLKVLAFHGEIRTVCDWTRDTSRAIASVAPLTAGGETALYQTVLTALDELRARKGRKILVVFTDGKDTMKGAPRLEEVLLRCREEQVVIHAIGLRTEDLDPGILRRMTDVCEGLYLEAATPQDISNRFQIAARRIRASFYRLILVGAPLGQFEKLPIEIRIGDSNAVHAKSFLP